MKKGTAIANAGRRGIMYTQANYPVLGRQLDQALGIADHGNSMFNIRQFCAKLNNYVQRGKIMTKLRIPNESSTNPNRVDESIDQSRLGGPQNDNEQYY